MRKRFFKSVLAIVLIAVMMTTNAFMALAEIAEPETAVTAEETVAAEEDMVEESFEEQTGPMGVFQEPIANVESAVEHYSVMITAKIDFWGLKSDFSSGRPVAEWYCNGVSLDGGTYNLLVAQSDGTDESREYLLTLYRQSCDKSDLEGDYLIKCGWSNGSEVDYSEATIHVEIEDPEPPTPPGPDPDPKDFCGDLAIDQLEFIFNEGHYDASIKASLTVYAINCYFMDGDPWVRWFFVRGEEEEDYLGSGTIEGFSEWTIGPNAYGRLYELKLEIPKFGPDNLGKYCIRCGFGNGEDIWFDLEGSITIDQLPLTVFTEAGDGGSVSCEYVAYIKTGTQIDCDDDKLYIGEGDEQTAVTAVADEGYEFAGWQGIPENGKVEEDLTITAAFTKAVKYYDIELNSATGGTVSRSFIEDVCEGTPIKADGEKLYIGEGDEQTAVTAVADEGYEFAGWQGIPESGKVEEDITLYAQWTPVAYTVEFNGNDATSGTMKNQSRTYDDGAELTANAFERTGYTFTGWNTEADGRGNAYANKQTANLRTTAGTVTLYAQWTPVAYTVEFNGNGATSGTMENQSRTYDDGKVLTANAFERTGYTFTGWNTKADGSGNRVTNKSKSSLKTIAGTITLYAQWKKNTYTITLKTSTGGKIKTATVLKNVLYGENYHINFDDSCLTVSTEDGEMVAERISEWYTCTGFTVNGKSNAPNSGEVTENLEIQAVFEHKAPEIINNLTDMTVYIEEPLGMFIISAMGDGGLTYQWQYQKPGTKTWKNISTTGESIENTNGNDELIELMSSSYYFIDVDKKYNGYKYRCIVKDSQGGKTTSNEATLTVKNKLVITSWPGNKKTALEGSTVIFSVAAEGDGDLTYQWQYRKPGSTKWVNSTAKSAKSEDFKVKASKELDGYQFRCEIKDSSETIRKTVKLSVTPRVMITAQPPETITKTEGAIAKIPVEATSKVAGEELTYQWQYSKNGVDWADIKTSTTKYAVTKELHVKATTTVNGYQYHCVIKDSKGYTSTSNPTTLVVK